MVVLVAVFFLMKVTTQKKIKVIPGHGAVDATGKQLTGGRNRRGGGGGGQRGNRRAGPGGGGAGRGRR
jgi:hypothetical protein